ncbi:uncharacterized protein LOC116003974 [Ipomoea triloba]|uniref:uncharacterized protein LOC116003974 n=1 Tax=Ipomoea triloba TaxID=35885 RepID=UPI00125E5A90|nr:uncharacterized protein LOC116003974 [Ipomoea triloba]
MGDFNDLLDPRDKVGRIAYPGFLLRGFQGAVRDSRLVDFPFGGYQYTWERGSGSKGWVQEKLDRILVGNEWGGLFRGATATSLQCVGSDHLPLLLTPNQVQWRGRKRLFRCEQTWISERGCREVVESAWEGDIARNIDGKIAMCGVRLGAWGGRRRREFRKEIEWWGAFGQFERAW